MKKFANLIILCLMLLSLAYSLPEVIAFGQVLPALSAPIIDRMLSANNIVNKPLTSVTGQSEVLSG
jgi:hypothetical protein